MFNQILLLIYRLFLGRGGPRLNWMERRFGSSMDTPISSDEKKNESSTYEKLFSQENRAKFEQLYLELLNEMNGVSYQQCGEVLDMLSFIQEISATALWKYRQNVGVVIEEFARNFDRLDVPDERVRLYESAQRHKPGTS